MVCACNEDKVIVGDSRSSFLGLAGSARKTMQGLQDLTILQETKPIAGNRFSGISLASFSSEMIDEPDREGISVVTGYL